MYTLVYKCGRVKFLFECLLYYGKTFISIISASHRHGVLTATVVSLLGRRHNRLGNSQCTTMFEVLTAFYCDYALSRCFSTGRSAYADVGVFVYILSSCSLLLSFGWYFRRFRLDIAAFMSFPQRPELGAQ